MQNTILAFNVILKVYRIWKCRTTTKTFPNPVLLLSVLPKPKVVWPKGPKKLALVTLNLMSRKGFDTWYNSKDETIDFTTLIKPHVQ